MSDPGTDTASTAGTDTAGPDTYTSGDGTTYGADGGLLSFPAGTPSTTSWDGDRDGDAAITDGAAYGEDGPVAVADTDGDTYADLVIPAS